MNIKEVQMNMPIKNNIYLKGTYQVIGIDKRYNSILTVEINENKLGLSYPSWSDVSLWHKVDTWA
jgi:hypothetical protein